ncbi:GMP synthase domain protein [Streptococcus pneumoniae 2070335]|nr:GMP synthase domain protein [Streptococcus pneumoniae 2070335]
MICIFVDHGLLRKGEADQVMDMLGGKFGLNIVKADAAKRFLDKLAGVSDPEQNVKSSVTSLSMYSMTKQASSKM